MARVVARSPDQASLRDASRALKRPHWGRNVSRALKRPATIADRYAVEGRALKRPHWGRNVSRALKRPATIADRYAVRSQIGGYDSGRFNARPRTAERWPDGNRAFQRPA